MGLSVENCNTMKGSPLIVGDFSMHVDVLTDPLAVCLSAPLDDFVLDQAVTFPTHQRGQTLDLDLHRRDEDVPQPTDVDYILD